MHRALNFVAVHRSTIRRVCFLVIICNLLLFALACSTAWITTAIGIIEALIPSVASIIGLLGTVGVTPAVLAAFTKWSTNATSALGDVQGMITEYNTAEASAQPGILGNIDSAIAGVLSELSALLPTIGITDPTTQAKLTSLITEWATELESLLNLIPVLKGEVAEHDEVMALVVKVKSAKKFKHDFNAKVDAFGPEAKKFHV